jgi:hypothetical protein
MKRRTLLAFRSVTVRLTRFAVNCATLAPEDVNCAVESARSRLAVRSAIECKPSLRKVLLKQKSQIDTRSSRIAPKLLKIKLGHSARSIQIHPRFESSYFRPRLGNGRRPARFMRPTVRAKFSVPFPGAA